MAGDALTIWGGAELGSTRQSTPTPTFADARPQGEARPLPPRGRTSDGYESAVRRPGDFQAAVDAWGSAPALDPNQYIWRRRIEQYGPRLRQTLRFL